jgi:hypothetical protein
MQASKAGEILLFSKAGCYLLSGVKDMVLYAPCLPCIGFQPGRWRSRQHQQDNHQGISFTVARAAAAGLQDDEQGRSACMLQSQLARQLLATHLPDHQHSLASPAFVL